MSVGARGDFYNNDLSQYGRAHRGEVLAGLRAQEEAAKAVSFLKYEVPEKNSAEARAQWAESVEAFEAAIPAFLGEGEKQEWIDAAKNHVEAIETLFGAVESAVGEDLAAQAERYDRLAESAKGLEEKITALPNSEPVKVEAEKQPADASNCIVC